MMSSVLIGLIGMAGTLRDDVENRFSLARLHCLLETCPRTSKKLRVLSHACRKQFPRGLPSVICLVLKQ